MSTLAFYVNGAGHLVKVVNGVEIVCSTQQSEEVARDIFSGLASIRKHPTVVHTLPRTMRRGLVLEQKQGDAHKSIPLTDLLPPGYDGSRGTFHVTVEFVPEEKKEA